MSKYMEAAAEIISQMDGIGVDYTEGKDETAVCIRGDRAESVIEALQKRKKRPVILQKPFPKMNDRKRKELGITWRNYVCPSCEHPTGITDKTEELKQGIPFYHPKFCVECGQALDWSNK